jgi:hypothetical protein
MMKRDPYIRIIPGLVLAVALLAAPPPALAQSDQGEEESPSELAQEGVDMLMRALRALMQNIPQYEAPEINENGDIIIRRKNPPKPPKRDLPPEEEPDHTDT